MVRGGHHPFVSIVVPMRNEADNALACLESLAATRYEPVEIIIVDDRSTDDTPQLLAGWSGRHTDARFRFIRLEDDPPPGWVGKPFAADAGIRQSTGEYVVVMDADVRQSPQSVAITSATLGRGLDFFVGVPRVTSRGPAGWCERYLYEMLYLASRASGSQFFATGAYAAFSRTFYDQVGGWAVVKGHPEVMALAARARAVGAPAALERRDDLCMQQYRSVPEATSALLRNLNYHLMPPGPTAVFVACLTWMWVGVSFVFGHDAPLGAVMVLAYCGVVAWSWRRGGVKEVVGGFFFAVPGAVWCTGVSLWSVLYQINGGAVRWRGRAFIR